MLDSEEVGGCYAPPAACSLRSLFQLSWCDVVFHWHLETGFFDCLNVPMRWDRPDGIGRSRGGARAAGVPWQPCVCCCGRRAPWCTSAAGGCSACDFGAFLGGSWSLTNIPERRHLKEIWAEMVGCDIYLFKAWPCGNVLVLMPAHGSH